LNEFYPSKPYFKCIECRKKESSTWYLKNIDKAKLRSKEGRKRFYTWFYALKDKPCTDCVVKYPYYVMQWDHLPGYEKIGTISNSKVTKNRTKILEEIKKCELVCANCHAVRTWKRATE
jgi:hypothetical protein